MCVCGLFIHTKPKLTYSETSKNEEIKIKGKKMTNLKFLSNLMLNDI